MASVLGSVVGQINASAAVTALLPGGAYSGEIPEEAPAPPTVIVADKQEPPAWLTKAWRQEKHTVTAAVYAKAATAAGAANPAEVLADAVEAAIDWTDLGMPGTLTLGVKRTVRTFAKEQKRAADDQRVFSVTLQWVVNLSVG